MTDARAGVVVETGAPALRHEALFYGSDEDYVAGVVPFIRDGLEQDQAVLVAVAQRQIALLREGLGADATDVVFADMAELGHNPALIIPEWQAFVEEYATGDDRVRGVGEPIWPERSAAELVECHRHEHLLNRAFARGPAWSLLCPYDAARLPRDVLERARHTHPQVSDGAVAVDSAAYHDVCQGDMPADPLPPPPSEHLQFAIEAGRLAHLRGFVGDHALGMGLSEDQAADLVLAANELATNTLMHSGGEGTLRLWRDRATVQCEVADGGRIDEPLADRTRPELGQDGGRGLWLANHLCDLVQVRSTASGTTIRLHVLLDD